MIIPEHNLQEASLGRISQLIGDEKNYVLAIITAFCDKYTLQENRHRNTLLAYELQHLHFGYNKVQGYYVMDNSNPVVEESFIAYSSSDRKQDFMDFIKSACKEFEQEAVLFVVHKKA